MRFILDNNLSPALAKALRALCEPENIEVRHLKEKFPQNVSDESWINALADEGNWAVVTQDRLIKNPLEREALRRSGLIAFTLSKSWASQRQWAKAAQLIRWWPRIMEQTGLVEGGAVFEVPWRFGAKGKFRTMKL